MIGLEGVTHGSIFEDSQNIEELKQDEFRPDLTPGVSKAGTVAAYSSAEAFRLAQIGACSTLLCRRERGCLATMAYRLPRIG